MRRSARRDCHSAIVVIFLAAIAIAFHGPTSAGEPSRARAVLVEEVRNDAPSFYVRVDVDHPGRVYRVGQKMRVSVRSEKGGHLYLFYLDASGTISCLFPNRFQTDNRLAAGAPGVEVPAPNARFALRIAEPTGREVLKAIVASRPLDQLELHRLTQGDYTVLTPQQIKGMSVEVKRGDVDWAEHAIEILTTSEPILLEPTTAGAPRRVGLFVGISDFADPGIRDLQVAHKDAEAMADVLRETCGLQEAAVLVDRQATLANIEQKIRRWLPEVTRPGDLVVLYWSGHGARCADDNGDEKDGYDEFLVPADGRLGDAATLRRTMLIDDTFGRWMQDLDGRKLVIILDTCHSGGQSRQCKGLASPSSEKPAGAFDFLDGDLQRTKDLGQKDTAILTSSLADQLSYERRENDLSTMTYFLVEEIRTRAGPLPLSDLYEAVKRRVAAYVAQEFPGSAQTPLLIQDASQPMYLRP